MQRCGNHSLMLSGPNFTIYLAVGQLEVQDKFLGVGEGTGDMGLKTVFPILILTTASLGRASSLEVWAGLLSDRYCFSGCGMTAWEQVTRTRADQVTPQKESVL